MKKTILFQKIYLAITVLIDKPCNKACHSYPMVPIKILTIRNKPGSRKFGKASV